MRVEVQLTDKIVWAEVVQNNPKTVWVRLTDGNVIKRHKIKHNVNPKP